MISLKDSFSVNHRFDQVWYFLGNQRKQLFLLAHYLLVSFQGRITGSLKDAILFSYPMDPLAEDSAIATDLVQHSGTIIYC